MHDVFRVHSTIGKTMKVRVVIAGNRQDALETHQQHYPEAHVVLVATSGRR